MANELITPSAIADEGLFQLENNCVMGNRVHREYKHEFVEIGDSVSIRKPVKFVAKDGAVRVNQDVKERNTSITINKRKHVSWAFTSKDLTLTVAEYSERYIKPALIVLANEMDLSLAEEGAREFYNSTGTPGTTPSSFTDLALAAAAMDRAAVPDDGNRSLVLDTDTRWSMADGMGGTGTGGIFNADMVEGMTRRGRLGRLAQFEIFGDQNISQHQVGGMTGTPLVNDAAFTNNTNTVTIDGQTGPIAPAVAYRKGDVITIDGVYGVNPVSRRSTGKLQQFVILADAINVGGGSTVTVYPELNDGSETATEAYQTVDALPADNAAITVLGQAGIYYPQNLGFHRNALAMVSVPLELPDSAVFKARSDWRGYSIRVIKGYDINLDEEAIRLDVMWGVKAIYPELGLRLWG